MCVCLWGIVDKRRKGVPGSGGQKCLWHSGEFDVCFFIDQEGRIVHVSNMDNTPLILKQGRWCPCFTDEAMEDHKDQTMHFCLQ